MTGLLALRAWIAVNRPGLHVRLEDLSILAALDVLNAEAGLSVSPDDNIEDTAPLFLAALQAKAAKEGA